MGDRDRSAAKQKKRKREEQLKKRRRAVIIVMVEIIMCLLLSITCYGVSVLNSYQFEKLDESIYKEETTRQKETVVVTSYVDQTDENGETYQSEVEVTVPPSSLSGYRNILVLGLDARSQFNFDDGSNTDVMIIVSINNDTGDIKMVSVLRDTIMKMEDGAGHAYDKANAQFTYSGISDTVSMVNRNLGLDIDEYVIVNWYGVATAINQLGGVELTIPNDRILYYFNSYLTFTVDAIGLWGQQLSAPGTYLMNGSQAVAFCRIRYGGYNDDGRTSNQREVIMKMLEKAKGMFNAGQINELLNVAETGLSNVKTNLTLPEILYTATEISDFNIVGSSQFPQEYTTSTYLGHYPAKYNCLDPLVANDFTQEVKNLHAFLFDDYYYEPSDFIKNISYQMYVDSHGL